MPYDLFISYSRRDNANGRIAELKQRIEADYRAFAQEDLRCFFDLEDIRGMDDWRHRILQGLRESQLLLLVLSPGRSANSNPISGSPLTRRRNATTPAPQSAFSRNSKPAPGRERRPASANPIRRSRAPCYCSTILMTPRCSGRRSPTSSSTAAGKNFCEISMIYGRASLLALPDAVHGVVARSQFSDCRRHDHAHGPLKGNTILINWLQCVWCPFFSWVSLPKELGEVGAILADAGSSSNTSTCAEAGMEPFIPPRREKHNQPLAERFAKSEPLLPDADPIRKMKHKLKTADGRALYAKRKCIIEPLFGIIKHVMGFRQFLLRGFKAVTGEWTLVSIAWNIKRMFALNV